MSLLSFPSTFTHSNCTPFTISEPRNSYHIVKFNKKNLANAAAAAYISGPLIKTSFLSSHSGLSLVAFGAKDSRGRGEEDFRALETVLRLYKAIKDRDINVLSDVIGEECLCVCNFVSTFQPCRGKTVLELFSSLLRYLGKNIEFVVQPTLHDGMSVGVHWKLEWKKSHIPLAQGFSFYMCYIFKGKVVIRNMEMFMEPLLHIEPLRLKIMGSMMNVMDRLGSKELSKGKAKWTIYTLLVLFFMAALLFFLRFS